MATLHRDLRSIGTWQRVLTLALLSLIVSLIVVAGFEWWWAVLIVVTGAVAALSWRIRARVTAEEFIVRSFFRTYRFRFSKALAFVDLPYEGWWSGFVPAELFGVGPCQIDVEMWGRGGRSLPATICGRKRAKRVADALNDMIPDELPEMQA